MGNAIHSSTARRINLVLVAALQARLDFLYAECKRFSDMTKGCPDEGDPIADEWDAVFTRSERTRKALVRAKYGMPYWQFKRRDLADAPCDLPIIRMAWADAPTTATLHH